jgi:hypothetical protein
MDCRECTISDEGVGLDGRDDLHLTVAKPKRWGKVLDSLFPQPGTDIEATLRERLLCDLWHDWIIPRYSQRSLTVAADRLPAISAVVKVFASILETDTYLAEIWKS